MVRGALQLVRGRVAFIPWVMFGITGVLTAFGALGPAAVAIIAPIALGFARQYQINALLMGMMVIHGAQAGGFSPISIYGVTVNNIAGQGGAGEQSADTVPRQPVLQRRPSACCCSRSWADDRCSAGRSTTIDDEPDDRRTATGARRRHPRHLAGRRSPAAAGYAGGATSDSAARETTSRCRRSPSPSIRSSR